MNPTDATPIQAGSAIILGSINVDTFIHVDAFPQPGETVLASAGTVGLGGKGANQAMAAALLGTDVQFLAQIGLDSAGDFAREQLTRFGVGHQWLMTAANLPTGAAYVSINSAGENTICVVSGANAEIPLTHLSQRTAKALANTKEPVTVALAQGETSAEATEAFALQCHAQGIRFVLNLAPVVELDEAVLAFADPLIVNEGEARILVHRFTGVDATLENPAAALVVAQLLAKKVARSAIITLGAEGAVVAGNMGSWHQPSPVPEHVIDTTGAGDAFVGAVVSLLSGGASLQDAVSAGVGAGSAAVSSIGTASSYPTAQQLALLLAAQKVAAP